jgi:hypothetical protein
MVISVLEAMDLAIPDEEPARIGTLELVRHHQGAGGRDLGLSGTSAVAATACGDRAPI